MHSKTPRPAARGAAGFALVALAGLASGCAPALDWREVRPADERLGFLLPCKPSMQERQVQLAGQPVALTLHACAAGGQTWGVAAAELGDPARLAAALAELAGAAAANIQGQVTAEQEARVPGATPNPGSRRLELRGRQPGGRAVVMHVAVFTHGTRVYQATALGEQVGAEAADTFFGALRITP
jgi:hypothetical protein